MYKNLASYRFENDFIEIIKIIIKNNYEEISNMMSYKKFLTF